MRCPILRYLYANLVGEWTCVTLDPESTIDGVPLDIWLIDKDNHLYDNPSVTIFYAGVTYQIHSSLLQIFEMTEKKHFS